ncbi:hypothetical protein [Geodermatophilus amargosae]|uniref:hypothetical protein n=1 Tax=Geodermatophilus amargosae TaxID=1296565 RepID=UPI0034E049F6
MTEPAVPVPAPAAPPTAPPTAPPPAPAPTAGVPAGSAPPTAPGTVPGPPGATAVGASTVPPGTGSAVSPGTAAPAPGGPPGGPSAAVVDDGPHPTGPVTGRPAAPPVARRRRTDPLTRMGPWAPVAGAVVGLLAGLLAVLLLRGRADAFGEGLALVFLVVGLTMLGAAGALLADEVRLVRRGAREAAVRPAWVEVTAGLINGLTPARLLLGSSAFVLFLAAYVAR